MQTGTLNARHAKRGGGRFGNFDVAIEKIFAGGEELEMVPMARDA